MSLDLIVPAHYQNFFQAERAVLAALANIDYPTRVILSLQGGLEEDFRPMLAALDDRDAQYTVLYDKEVRGRNAAIEEGMDIANAAYVAVLYPTCEIRDPKWFGKLQSIFLKTPHPGMVSVLEVEPSNSNTPPRRLDKKYHHPTGPLFLTSRTAKELFRPKAPIEDDWQYAFSVNAANQGGYRWVHPGVLYKRIECQDHLESDRESSSCNS